MSRNTPLPKYDPATDRNPTWPNGGPWPTTKRVRVVRSFYGYAPQGYELPHHLTGAVVDLPENFARSEMIHNRVEEVDPDTPLCEGTQPETTGETLEEITKRKAEEAAEAAAKQASLADEVKQLRAELLAMKKAK